MKRAPFLKATAPWADWWGFKHEAFAMAKANIAIVDQIGACGMILSD
ncbi:MAG: hypothetical protein K0U59_09755 [Gammaproteobacteria bacterium]|nr:hypothetical protein [Gammaproteobacteria bacterium]